MVKPKNIGKVAKVIIKNPHKTSRELAKETGLARNTVMEAQKELSQNGAKDETISYIVGGAKYRLKRISNIFDRYIDQIEEKAKLDNRDISLAKDIAKDDVARVMQLGGEATNEDGGLKDGVTIVWGQ